jgi:error-prone DNA polymerase
LLTAIHRALDLIAVKRDEASVTVQDVPAEDPATYAMMYRADAVGVLQIEGRALTMLPKSPVNVGAKHPKTRSTYRDHGL